MEEETRECGRVLPNSKDYGLYGTHIRVMLPVVERE